MHCTDKSSAKILIIHLMNVCNAILLTCLVSTTAGLWSATAGGLWSVISLGATATGLCSAAAGTAGLLSGTVGLLSGTAGLSSTVCLVSSTSLACASRLVSSAARFMSTTCLLSTVSTTTLPTQTQCSCKHNHTCTRCAQFPALSVPQTTDMVIKEKEKA